MNPRHAADDPLLAAAPGTVQERLALGAAFVLPGVAIMGYGACRTAVLDVRPLEETEPTGARR